MQLYRWLKDLRWLRRRVQRLVHKNALLVAALLQCRSYSDDPIAVRRVVNRALAINRGERPNGEG